MALPTTQEIEIVMTGKPVDLLARLPVDSMSTRMACYHLDEVRWRMREAVAKAEMREIDPAR